MAELKRNMMELVKNPEGVNKGDEPEIEKVWTPGFISLRVARNAVQLYNELINDDETSELDKFDKMVDFVANEIYAGKITKDDLYDRMHGPGMDGQSSAKETLEEQIFFASQGMQTESTKNFLGRKD